MPKLKDIIGQDLIKKQITESIANDRVSCGYILTGEKGSGKDAHTQVVRASLGYRAHQSRSERSSAVSRKRQKRKEGGSGTFQFFGGDADGARPHDTDGKTA